MIDVLRPIDDLCLQIIKVAQPLSDLQGQFNDLPPQIDKVAQQFSKTGTAINNLPPQIANGAQQLTICPRRSPMGRSN